MPVLRCIETALPPYQLSAAETREHLARVYPGSADRRFSRVVEATKIKNRHLVRPLEVTLNRQTRGERNLEYTTEATRLAEAVALQILKSDPRASETVRTIVAVSCTGYMMPSIDAHLINRLSLPPDVRRLPITELGCSAGVAALGVARELALGQRDAVILVLSVELCSLCLQMDDASSSDVIGSLLFADGAAAAVVAGDSVTTGPAMIASGSALIPGTLEHLETKLSVTGLHLNLSPSLPRLLRQGLRRIVERFLRSVGTDLSEIRFLAVHPGGPKILQSVGEGLEIDESLLRASWDVLERCGNMSSATIFFVLERVFTHYTPNHGDLGLVLSFGPGVTCEMLLLRWQG